LEGVQGVSGPEVFPGGSVYLADDEIMCLATYNPGDWARVTGYVPAE
jgi:hypothetical protein